MREDDRRGFGELIETAMAVYGRKITTPVIALWWAALARYQFAEVRAAMSAHLQDPDAGQYAPKPADVIRQIDGGKETQSLMAWALVERGVRSVGGYQSVVFHDAITMRVLEDMGGWIALCAITDAELPFRRSEFVKRYQGYAVRGAPDWPRRLAGIVERDLGVGYAAPAPVLLGDKARCMAVLTGGQDFPRRLPAGVA